MMREKKDPVVIALLDAMGYHDPVRVCKTCVHYVETDCSGNMNAENEHCKLNPAIPLPIESAGWCKHHVPKRPPPIKPTESFARCASGESNNDAE